MTADTATATRETGTRRADLIQIWVQPIVIAALAIGVLVWAFARDLTDTQATTVNANNVLTLVGQHLAITAVVTLLVLAIAIPLGVLLTRKRFQWMSPVFIGIANIGQAAPAIGLLVLLFLWTSKTGFWIGVLPIAFYSLLPVLRNTMLGLREVDDATIDAARGQGMSSASILTKIEMPLAIPFILAGLRTSLVLAVGTATLSFMVDAGGLGILIDTGYKLRDNVTLILGAVLAVCVALTVDWLGALAEQYLGPKGLR